MRRDLYMLEKRVMELSILRREITLNLVPFSIDQMLQQSFDKIVQEECIAWEEGCVAERAVE